MNFFELPYVAAILGFLFGAILIGAYGYAAVTFTGERAKYGMYASFAISFIELILTAAVLLLYRTYAKPGVIWFGVAMAGGFIAGFTFLVIKFVPRIQKK